MQTETETNDKVDIRVVDGLLLGIGQIELEQV